MGENASAIASQHANCPFRARWHRNGLPRSSANREPDDASAGQLIVSPPILLAPVDTKPDASLPLADRLLATLGEDVYVLHVRRGGNLEKLVNQCLTCPARLGQRWNLAVGPDLVPQSLVDRWSPAGATAWYLTSSPQDSLVQANRESTRVSLGPFPSAIVPLGQLEAERYLCHWTRGHPGPWPDQNEKDYICGLLFDEAERDRSALATLLRILQMKRLLGTSRLTREKAEVVSFTELPLTEFRSRRVFRPMHARWDFEPYGVSIDRNWLLNHGTRPVIYGNEMTWRGLAIEDRPFFQFCGRNREDRLREDRRSYDWTQEREWRHVGDVDLGALGPSDALVFVADRVEARRVAAVSPWPVTIVE